MRLTIKDIAYEANVSVSTVSKCLNGYSDVSEETKKHVIETVRKMDYVPNNFARYISNRPTCTIGLTVPDIKDPYFAQSTFGIETRLKEYGYQLFLGNVNRSEAGILAFIRKAREMRFDGLVITPDSWSDDVKNALRALEIPVISIRRRPPEDCDIPFIDVDHYAGAYSILEYIYSCGHRNIGHITLPNEAGIYRLEAYKSFCKDKHLEERVASSDIPASILPSAVHNGIEAAGKLFSEWPDTTAVFCGSDFICAGVIEYLAMEGKSVPDDVSLAGVGNNDFSSLSAFNLTTIEMNRYEMGLQTADMLMEAISGNRVESRLCSGTVVVRGSVARI